MNDGKTEDQVKESVAVNVATEETSSEETYVTNKELQARLISEKGWSETAAKGVNTREALLQILGEEGKTEKVKKVSTLEDKEDKDEAAKINRRYNSKKDIMRRKLFSQERVKMKIPLEGKEKPGVVTNIASLSPEQRKRAGIRLTEVNGVDTVPMGGAWRLVTINGYTVHVPKGKYVQVPLQVADILDESDRETAKAGQDLLLDRIDPETGKSVGESM